MKTLKWPTAFQYIIVTLGFTIGIYFSMKSNQVHSESHKEIAFSTPICHGFINISSDSIIPQIRNLKVTKDPISGYNLHLETRNFQFTPVNVSKKHVSGEGHAHLLINGNKAARIYSNWFHIPELGYKIFELEVTLNANSHATMCINQQPISIKLSDL